MTRLMIAVYDNRRHADDVLIRMHEAGFAPFQVAAYHPNRRKKTILKHVVTDRDDVDETAAELSASALDELGLPVDDTEHYFAHLLDGHSIIVVRSDEELSGRATQVLDHHPVVEAKKIPSFEEADDEFPLRSEDRTSGTPPR